MTDSPRDAGMLKLIGGRLCLDFANTVDWLASDHPEEWLTSYGSLLAWSRHAGALTKPEAARLAQEAARHPAAAARVLNQAIAFREAIFQIFSTLARGRTPEAGDVAALNDLLVESLPRLRLTVTQRGGTWTWAEGGGALEQPLWPVARSAAELLTSKELRRVGMCPGSGCGWLFVDRSRNRSRRWCAMEDCGNREKARRHYRRSKE